MAEDFAKERAHHVDWKSAKVAGFSLVPGTRFKELTLFYPFSDTKLAESAARLLADYTSSKNFTDTPAKKQYVVDPLGSVEKYVGRYRQVSLHLGKYGPDAGILQVLREGFLQSLPEDETKDDEARLVSAVRDPQTGLLTLTRVWINIDPEYLAKIEAKKALVTTVVNPQCEVLNDESDPLIGQKQYSGTFVVSERRGVPAEGDPVCSLIETLQEVETVATLADLSALTPEIVQGNEIRALFGVSSDNASIFGESDYLGMRYAGLSQGSRGYCMGEAPTNLSALVVSGDYAAWAAGTAYTVAAKVLQTTTRYVSTKDHTAGVDFAADVVLGLWTALDGWMYADRKFEDQQDGTGVFTVMVRRERWDGRATAASANIVAQAAGLDRQQKSLTRVWLRRTKAAFDTLTGVGGEALLPLAYQGVTYSHDSWSANELDGGGFNITQHLVVPSNSLKIHDRETSGLIRAYERIYWLGASSTVAYQRCLVEEFRKVFSDEAVAYAYADGSTLVFDPTGDEHTPTPMGFGKVNYIGNNKYEAFCVIIRAFPAPTVQTWLAPSSNPS